MKFKELKEKIIAAAYKQATYLQATYLVTQDTLPQKVFEVDGTFSAAFVASMQEAKRIRKAFRLGILYGLYSTAFIAVFGTYPPNMFPAVGVLLDSYPAEFSACILCFGFTGKLKGNLMMFLEDIEKIEALRKKLMGHKKESRIDKAAEVIARCLCLMDFESFARETFHGMVNPSMRERVKTKLYELDNEVAQLLIQ